jgi:hypothetical protein
MREAGLTTPDDIIAALDATAERPPLEAMRAALER